jgi:arylformamidase
MGRMTISDRPKCQYLSHVLSEATPLYGGRGCVSLQLAQGISVGGVSNSSLLQFPAHSGTHVDAPFHFDNSGRTLDSYPAEFWHFFNVWFMAVEAEPCEIIGIDRIGALLELMPKNTDLLLIKTGYESLRTTFSADEYAKQGPGMAPEVGVWLRRNRSIRMIGFDFISLSSFQSREMGREAHRAFLGPLDSIGAPPILLLEDMHLSDIEEAPDEVWILPLRFGGSDGAPATVVALNF